MVLSMFVCAMWGKGGEGRHRRVCGLGVWCVGGGDCAISASAEVAGWAVPLPPHPPFPFSPAASVCTLDSLSPPPPWPPCRSLCGRGGPLLVSPTTNLNSSKTFQRRTTVGCVTSDSRLIGGFEYLGERAAAGLLVAAHLLALPWPRPSSLF